MDGRRSGGGGRRQDRGSRKASKKVGYLPRAHTSQNRKRQHDMATDRSRRATSDSLTADGHRRADGGGARIAAGDRRCTRRFRSVNSHSSDQYLSISTDDDGRDRDVRRYTRRQSSGRYADRGRHSSPRDSRFSSRARDRHNAAGGDTRRARDSRSSSRRDPSRGSRRRGDRGRSRSASWGAGADASFRTSSDDDYRYEEHDRSAWRDRRQRRDSQSNNRRHREDERGTSPKPRDALRRSRSRSPPPPPRQRPHQPQSRKYARQEAGPPSAPAAAAAHSAREELADTAAARPPRWRARPQRQRSHSPSIVSTPSSRRTPPHRHRAAQEEHGDGVFAPRGATAAVASATTTASGQGREGPCANEVAQATPPEASPPPHVTAAPSPERDVEQEATLTPAEREERYLAWLYAKPTRHATAAAAAPEPSATDGTTGRGGVDPSVGSLAPQASAAGSVAASEDAPPAPWEQVVAERRFLVTTNRRALGLIDWQETHDALARARKTGEGAQRPEEEVQDESARSQGLNSSRTVVSRTHDGTFRGWAAVAATQSPLRQSTRSSVLNTPRGAPPSDAAPSGFPSGPPTPFRTPQGGLAPLPPNATETSGIGNIHTSGSGDDTPARASTGTATTHHTPHLLQLPPTTLVRTPGLEEDGLTLAPAVSAPATPREPFTGGDASLSSELEWIPEAWRTDATTGAVVSSRLFLPRAVFLDMADAEAAQTFRWQFENGFAHRQPPWFTCADPDSNAEHPWACEWMNQLPPSRPLAEQLPLIRDRVAAKRAQAQKPEEERAGQPDPVEANGALVDAPAARPPMPRTLAETH